MRVTEHTYDLWQGSKSGKSVCVQQALLALGQGRHRNIMPIPRSSSSLAKPAVARLRGAWQPSACPHNSAKTQKTIVRLAQCPEFREVVRTLRGEGWLDWHILQAVMHLVLNYRIRQAIRLGLSEVKAGELAGQWLDQIESVDAIPVPLEGFSADQLKLNLRLSMLATLKTYGLESPTETPDLLAIGDFLGERYRYWTDDVEHPDYGF